MSPQEELHVMQLAAITAASLQNTDRSARERIGKDSPYWTRAYEDVCVAIDREMRERKRAEKAEQNLRCLDQSSLKQVRRQIKALRDALSNLYIGDDPG